jgi:hypothetical protein
MKPTRYALAASCLILALIAGLSRLTAADDKPAASTFNAKPDAEGFVALFDGKTLDNWDGDPDLWSVQDGCITGTTTDDKKPKGGANTFLIFKGGDPGDFELHAMFKLRNHNSGIQYRSKKFPNAKDNHWVVGGYQADMDGENAYTGICYEERGRGILCKRGEKIAIAEDGKKTVEGKTAEDTDILAAIKKGDWNEYVIICKGPHCVQKINGVTTADFTDNQKGKSADKGVLALQMHQGPPMLVQFKEIRMKKLD